MAVTAYGFVAGMILPLTFEVYKPRERLKDGDAYYSKPQIAATMLRPLQAMGFQFALVLADSLYGESKVNFVHVLDEWQLPYIVAIRSHHAVWLPQDQAVYQEPWQKFERTLSNGTTETRYMAEVLYGKRHRKQDWLFTTDPQTMPDKATSFVMVAAPAITLPEMGDSYGLRTWIEYGLKQSQKALGWAAFRLTH